MTQNCRAKHYQTENGRLQSPLRVSSVEVCNFRLLRDVKVDLTSETTVLIGHDQYPPYSYPFDA